jgi:hypothetical protein
VPAPALIFDSNAGDKYDNSRTESRYITNGSPASRNCLGAWGKASANCQLWEKPEISTRRFISFDGLLIESTAGVINFCRPLRILTLNRR